MEAHRTPDKTPPKFIENLPRDIRDAVNPKNPLQSSPFCSLPNHTTPPSRNIKIKNPFEAAINEHLHSHIFSPSVFADAKNPRNSDNFKWNIDDISSLKPAHIDERTIAQFEQTNSEDDVHVQARIEKYFNEIHIVPSPWNSEMSQAPLLRETESPHNTKGSEASSDTSNVWTQTVLSLPPKLPEEVEKILTPFFTFNEDQHRQSVDLNSSLCRRLFHSESAGESPKLSVSSRYSEISVIGSPIAAKEGDGRKRNFDTSIDRDLIPVEISPIHNSTPRKLTDCEISPIVMNIEDVQFRNAISESSYADTMSPIMVPGTSKNNQSFARMDFSGHMSVDNSFNMAPENDVGDVQNQTNLSESPLRTNEFMESSCNWGIEYNNISINDKPIRRNLFHHPIPHSSSCMDISNLITPKSKIINSQRKKLSDSFNLNDSTDDEFINIEEENTRKSRKYNYCDNATTSRVDTSENMTDENIVLSQNTQDTGYNTCTEFSQKNYSKTDEEMTISDTSCPLLLDTDDDSIEDDKRNWKFCASTPSKRESI